MASVSASIIINRPVEQVFTIVTSADSQKSLQGGAVSLRITPEGPIGVGTTYHFTTETLGRKMETELVVSELETNVKWSIKTVNAPTPIETIYLFEDVNGTTKLSITMELAGVPTFAEALIKPQMQKTLEEQCNKLKQMLEK